MKKSKLIGILPVLSLTISSLPAIADQCSSPPVLNARTCTVPASGGSCSFGFDEDGIVEFPNEVVTGPVTISGGRNVYVGPGQIRLQNNEHYAVAFSSPTNAYVEGLHVDANGYCDVFAVRNHREHQLNFTFQNIYATGPEYNNPDVQNGGCHGDLIQYQPAREGAGGGMALTVENFAGVTNAQGFFIPGRGTGDFRADLRNVHIRRSTTSNYTPLMWLSSTEYGDKPYPATLDNVWLDWAYPGGQVMPTEGTIVNGGLSFPAETLIAGTISGGTPPGPEDLDYPQHTGLNYDRAYFCSTTEPAPEPVVETQPDTNTEPAPELTETDNEAPSVQFDSPSNGSTIRRRSDASILISAGDNVAVAEVELRIQGRRVAMFTGPGPHSYDWNVRSWGRYSNLTFSAEATDTSGNISETSVSINVVR